MRTPMTNTSRDWLGSKRTNLLAWWFPLAIMLAGLFAPESLRTASWVVALGWMGAACMLNARRCNRTHCRYTGPYYLAMTFPVVVLGIASAGIYSWMFLAAPGLHGSTKW